MYANKILNIKAQCKILFKAKMEDMVVHQNKNSQLGDLVLSQKCLKKVYKQRQNKIVGLQKIAHK